MAGAHGGAQDRGVDQPARHDLGRGQVTQISARPGTNTAFVVLRDPSADVSLTLTCASALVRDAAPTLTEGSRVIVHGRPTFYVGRGTLSLRVDEIRPVGIGELLARIERLRRLLAAEGLFDPARKRPLPFLPRTVGLITGRASAAERDVLTNARRRWPAVRFRVINVAVQGPTAVPQIRTALSTLDTDPAVDVIVVARGGGSVEDLLPFSDEALCRAVASCRTPVVSAIGHEPDTPLLDHVADLRCSTPTDAGKRIVPDVTEETERIAALRDRIRRALHGWVDREHRLLDQLRSRPVLARPQTLVEGRAEEVGQLLGRARRCLDHRLDRAGGELTQVLARLRALSPASTLNRGYAIVQRLDDGTVLRAAAQVEAGDAVRVRLAEGEVTATVTA